MIILEHKQIQQKIKRISYEIMENHHDKEGIVIAGINQNGKRFAQKLLEELNQIATTKIETAHLSLDPAQPNQEAARLEASQSMEGKHIIVVDDVANTGRTLFYACQPLLKDLPNTIEAAVLVDRKHKSFPIKVDYVGLSLATTLKEHIDVRFNEGHYAVELS